MTKTKGFIAVVVVVVLVLTGMMVGNIISRQEALKGDGEKLAAGDRAAIEALAMDFVRNCFVEGAPEADPSPYIAKDAEALRRLVAIRQTLSTHSSHDQLVDLTLENTKYLIQADGSLEVFLQTMESRDSSQGEVCYRMLLEKEAGKWRIVKVLSDDGLTHPQFFCAPQVFEDYDMANYAEDIDKMDLDAMVAELDDKA